MIDIILHWTDFCCPLPRFLFVDSISRPYPLYKITYRSLNRILTWKLPMSLHATKAIYSTHSLFKKEKPVTGKSECGELVRERCVVDFSQDSGQIVVHRIYRTRFCVFASDTRSCPFKMNKCRVSKKQNVVRGKGDHLLEIQISTPICLFGSRE